MNKSTSGIALLCAVILSSTDATCLIFPSGGEVADGYRPNSNVTIRWDNVLEAAFVDVGIWDGDLGQLHILAERITASVGSVNCNLPATLGEGTHYRFVVRNSDQHHRAEFSSGFLRVVLPQPTVMSVNEFDQVSPVQSTPLPATDNVEFTWRDVHIQRIELWDVAERLVLTRDVGPSETSAFVSVSTLASGSYTTRLFTTDGNVFIKQVLVNR